MGKRIVCGKEMDYKADKCGDCEKKSLQDIFAKNPELKHVFKEMVHENWLMTYENSRVH